MSGVYVFKIENQSKKNSNQKDLRDSMIDLLEIAPIFFELEEVGDEYKGTIKLQEFTFETQEEARQFAIKILRTESIFFCELKEVKVE